MKYPHLDPDYDDHRYEYTDQGRCVRCERPLPLLLIGRRRYCDDCHVAVEREERSGR